MPVMRRQAASRHLYASAFRQNRAPAQVPGVRPTDRHVGARDGVNFGACIPSPASSLLAFVIKVRPHEVRASVRICHDRIIMAANWFDLATRPDVRALDVHSSLAEAQTGQRFSGLSLLTRHLRPLQFR